MLLMLVLVRSPADSFLIFTQPNSTVSKQSFTINPTSRMQLRVIHTTHANQATRNEYVLLTMYECSQPMCSNNYYHMLEHTHISRCPCCC